MKAIPQLLLAGAVVTALGLVAHAAPGVGRPAPDFTLTDIDGRTHTLAAYLGRTVVLEWVNPDCPVVMKHYEKSGNLPATQKAAVGDGVVWFTINSAGPGEQGDYDAARVAAWKRRNRAAFTAYLPDRSGKVGKLYDVRHTPTLFVINAGGALVYAGGIDSISSGNPADITRATNYVQAALADLKSGRPVAKPVTKAYGCNVKYAD